MKSFKLVLVTFALVLLMPYNFKTVAQQNSQNKPKELVVAFEQPGMDKVIVKKDIPYLKTLDSTLKMDIYYPPNFDFQSKIPAIIIVYGYTNKAQIKLTGNQLRKWSWYISWGKIIAASGMAAIAYETLDPENDLTSLIKYLNSNVDKLQIDINNIGAYTCSANTPTAIANILNNSNSSFKCAAIYYGIFLTKDFKYLSLIDSLSQNMGFVTPRLSEPASWKKDVPLMIVSAGKDYVPHTKESLSGFIDKAINQNLPITWINYSNGLHGFDAYNDNETTRQIINNTLEFWKFHLK